MSLATCQHVFGDAPIRPRIVRHQVENSVRVSITMAGYVKHYGIVRTGRAQLMLGVHFFPQAWSVGRSANKSRTALKSGLLAAVDRTRLLSGSRSEYSGTSTTSLNSACNLARSNVRARSALGTRQLQIQVLRLVGGLPRS